MNTIPVQVWKSPEGSRTLRLPDFQTTGTSRLQSCQFRGSVDHTTAIRTKSMKNSKDTIRHQTSDLTACSAVPQPTAPCFPSINTSTMLFTFPKQVVINYKETVQEQECYEAVQVKNSCTEAIPCAYHL